MLSSTGNPDDVENLFLASEDGGKFAGIVTFDQYVCFCFRCWKWKSPVEIDRETSRGTLGSFGVLCARGLVA